jgi:hypothetical protein
MGSLFINGLYLVIVLGLYLYSHIINGYVLNYFNYNNAEHCLFYSLISKGWILRTSMCFQTVYACGVFSFLDPS